jgi:hypothetical protein
MSSAYTQRKRHRPEKLSLDRYLIIEPDGHREIYNWLQYFSLETLDAESPGRSSYRSPSNTTAVRTASPSDR